MSISFITNNEINEMDNIDNIDDIDFGINIQDQSVKYENDKKIEIAEDEILNPFYVGLNGGNLHTLSWGDIYRNYNSVVILTIASNNSLNTNNSLETFFKKIIKSNELTNFQGITYFRCGINILKMKDHYFKSVVISQSDLKKIFSNGIFNESEIVLSIFEMDEQNTRLYCDMYQKNNEISDIENRLNIFNHYIGDKKNLCNINIHNLFSNLKDFDYWKNKDNLDINITN